MRGSWRHEFRATPRDRYDCSENMKQPSSKCTSASVTKEKDPRRRRAWRRKQESPKKLASPDRYGWSIAAQEERLARVARAAQAN
eukprot:6454422-Pyramimonas_sp.AAC.1